LVLWLCINADQDLRLLKLPDRESENAGTAAHIAIKKFGAPKS
jgi:hypothetical protein